MKLIPRYIYVSPLLFLLLFFSWTIDRTYELIVLYSIVIIHEFSHIFVAKMYNLKTEKILITPIGIQAKINFDRNIKHNETAICAAGPISNLVMIIIGIIINTCFLNQTQIIDFFIMSNLAILILNLLPVFPLDGGRIFKNVLLVKFGYKKTITILSHVSNITSTVFIVLGIYQLFNCWYNWSLLFIGIFIYLCLYKEKEEIEYSLIRELIYKNQNLIKNKIYNVRYLVCVDELKLIDIIRDLRKNKYHIIKVFSKNNEMLGELTEGQIFSSIIKLGYNANLNDVMSFYTNNDCKTS